MKRELVPVVLAADANYAPGLQVTRASILRSCATPERLEWHVFDERTLADLDVRAFKAYNTSKMTYLRLFLPELLPNVDWVIYVDVDTVWTRDICELWDSVTRGPSSAAIYWVKDMGIAMAACRSWFARAGFKIDAARYGCAGVCVMNLRKLKGVGLCGKALDIVREHGTPPYADQDLLNAMLNRDCGLLPPYWDVLKGLPDWRTPAVYHLTGVGRHFHDAVPPGYPPQYQFWWNVAHGSSDVHWRSRLLAALWPLRFIAHLLPLAVRERVMRQWFFAKILTNWGRIGIERKA